MFIFVVEFSRMWQKRLRAGHVYEEWRFQCFKAVQKRLLSHKTSKFCPVVFCPAFRSVGTLNCSCFLVINQAQKLNPRKLYSKHYCLLAHGKEQWGLRLPCYKLRAAQYAVFGGDCIVLACDLGRNSCFCQYRNKFSPAIMLGPLFTSPVQSVCWSLSGQLSRRLAVLQQSCGKQLNDLLPLLKMGFGKQTLFSAISPLVTQSSLLLFFL